MVGNKRRRERNEFRVAEHDKKIAGNINDGIGQRKIVPPLCLDDLVTHSREFVTGNSAAVPRDRAQTKSRTEFFKSFVPESYRFVDERLT